MRLSSAKRGLGRTAAVLGVLQGLAWTVMSLLAILLHYWAPQLNVAPTYEKMIESLFYHKFIVDDGTDQFGVGFIVTPANFVIVMWVYFLISIIWCSISFDIFQAIHYNKNRQIVVMRFWGMTTLIISAIDVAFVLFLGIDYAQCDEDSLYGVTESEYFCYLINGIMMAIAARGFTLWLINLVLSIIMLTESKDIEREDNSYSESLYSYIPRAKLASIPIAQRY